MPLYSIPEAAHYLQIPRITLRDWVNGHVYPTASGRHRSAPVLGRVPRPTGTHAVLSFLNVVEAHVLSAVRRQYRVSMPKVREALTFLETHFPSQHPLADQLFVTDGVDLFLDTCGPLINITKDGQLAMRALLHIYLSRIERDATGEPVRLYLFTHLRHAEPLEALAASPKAIVIDPYISFGRPVLAGTGIATAIVAERYKAGESIGELAHDYGLTTTKIEEAIRCELPVKAA
jgi:uncharacterized protein (DUF433 family)